MESTDIGHGSTPTNPPAPSHVAGVWTGRKYTSGLIAAALLALATAGYGAWHLTHPSGTLLEGPPPAVSRGAEQASATPRGPIDLPDFASIVQRYGAAVVNIQVSGEMRRDEDDADAPNNPLFRFFPRFGMPIPREPMPSHGEGSGFIISPDGVILTNAHVVDGADEVVVKLTDRREFKARVRGVDRPSDVAVLKIEAHDLPTVHLGRADPVRVGDWVLAIGSPFGFENSATAGIVSGKARALPDEGYVAFIQTDVAVNPGNSGGPLFNLHGDVVGINSQIYSRTGGYQGLSFAIPIDVAVQVKEQILHAGKVTRGRLGVTIQEMNQSLADSFGLGKPAGALISAVEAGSPADKAGLREGDVILEVNGHPLDTSGDLPPLIAVLKPGSTVSLGIWRDRGRREMRVRVGELVQEAKFDQDQSEQGGRLGLAVRPLSTEEHRAAEVASGLLVVGVTGPAARAGVQDGDVILALNGREVRSVEGLRRLASQAGKHIALLIQRGDTKLFIPLNLS